MKSCDENRNFGQSFKSGINRSQNVMAIVFLVIHIIGKQFRNRKRRMEITPPGTIRVILKIIAMEYTSLQKR